MRANERMSERTSDWLSIYVTILGYRESMCIDKQTTNKSNDDTNLKHKQGRQRGRTSGSKRQGREKGKSLRRLRSKEIDIYSCESVQFFLELLHASNPLGNQVICIQSNMVLTNTL